MLEECIFYKEINALVLSAKYQEDLYEMLANFGIEPEWISNHFSGLLSTIITGARNGLKPDVVSVSLNPATNLPQLNHSNGSTPLSIIPKDI